MRMLMMVMALTLAPVAWAVEEEFVPILSVTMEADYPQPYGRTTLTARMSNQDNPTLRVLSKLDFASQDHRVCISPDLLANFPTPQITSIRLTYSEGPENDHSASIYFPFGDYSYATRGYSHVTFVIDNGELAFYIIARPRDDGSCDEKVVQIKK